MRVYGAFCFPFFVWIILLAFWQFRRFSWRAAFAFANRLTLVGAARTTILYIALWGVAAGLSMIVLQRAGIAQGEDLLYACQVCSCVVAFASALALILMFTISKASQLQSTDNFLATWTLCDRLCCFSSGSCTCFLLPFPGAL